RHTRSYGDWSSDVCSSDLSLEAGRGPGEVQGQVRKALQVGKPAHIAGRRGGHHDGVALRHNSQRRGIVDGSSVRVMLLGLELLRSEERRVGKEGRGRWWRE